MIGTGFHGSLISRKSKSVLFQVDKISQILVEFRNFPKFYMRENSILFKFIRKFLRISFWKLEGITTISMYKNFSEKLRVRIREIREIQYIFHFSQYSFSHLPRKLRYQNIHSFFLKRETKTKLFLANAAKNDLNMHVMCHFL